MKSFASKLALGIFGLTLATAPLTASANSVGVAIGFGGGGGVVYHENDHRHWHHAPPPYYGPHRPYYAPYYEGGYYGPRGYYSRGGWYNHRRWHNGVWLYF